MELPVEKMNKDQKKAHDKVGKMKIGIYCDVFDNIAILKRVELSKKYGCYDIDADMFQSHDTVFGEILNRHNMNSLHLWTYLGPL